ncbi:hypothetical protein GIB67_026342 [Kingdonia uniflora]|uniref:Uncharacterized protein n=1 Tax=Kingdonia uniflora TaxID=39325 RepID=A0A7J7P6T9_9MAGN|nr:hypothetical protein GIB67_026342 [Kingdonia uniflora]
MGCKPSSNEKLGAIGLAIIAVFSPLYINQKSYYDPEQEIELQSIEVSSWLLPLLLVVLIVFITISQNMDQSFKRLDPYWIHRMGGSSCGISILLVVLALVLKCKMSLRNWEG